MSHLKKSILVAALLSISSPAYAAGKFDGGYLFKVTKSIGPCSVRPGNVVVKDGKISDSVKSDGQTLKVSGKVSDSGKVKGRIGGSLARFKGVFENGNFAGKWNAQGGCRGEFVIQ